MSTAPTIGRTAAAALALLLAAPAWSDTPAAVGTGPSGELHLRWDDRQANDAGPLAAANQLQPGIAPPTPAAAPVEALLRHPWPGTSAATAAPALAACG